MIVAEDRARWPAIRGYRLMLMKRLICFSFITNVLRANISFVVQNGAAAAATASIV